MAHLLLFGLGYSGRQITAKLAAAGWQITTTRRQPVGPSIAFDDAANVRAAIASATHILSSVPPADGKDPVLSRYGAEVEKCSARWIGYVSETGVYGDTGCAYVDETAAIGGGRRTMRVQADLGWQPLRRDVRVFRLTGNYAHGRSPQDSPSHRA